MVKCLPEFEYFLTVFLKNKNFISKIKRSKDTDYSALNVYKYLVVFFIFISAISSVKQYSKCLVLARLILLVYGSLSV